MNNHLVTIKLDQVSFELREAQDFTWLKNLGTVFCVFAEQDSGNLAFGVEKEGSKLFIKYAGAKTKNYKGQVSDAIDKLKNSVPLYEELKYPGLIELIDHFELKNGYALVFKWVDGECLHAHWTFGAYDKYTHPKSTYYRYKHLPVSKRLKSLEKLFAFHKHVEEKGYLAVDFYDGSIMYDFENDTTTICDIDYYHKKPLINTLGRKYWGSSRFKAPEENELNAVIDERTNVYTMGAMAFCLLGGERDHSFEKWDASKSLYQVALHATELNPNNRYCSVREFYSEWLHAASLS